MSTKLTEKQVSDYRQMCYELRSWVDDAPQMAAHLKRIRDERLYRGDHKSFEDFCQAELGYTSRWARQIIQSAETIEELSGTMVPDQLPSNERQVRELARLPAGKRAEVWQEVLEDGEPTSAKVKEKVRQHVESAKAKPAKISGGVTFDTAEIEAAAAAAKAPKSGKPSISTGQRREAMGLVSKLIRTLDAMGQGGQLDAHTDAIIKWIKEAN